MRYAGEYLDARSGSRSMWRVLRRTSKLISCDDVTIASARVEGVVLRLRSLNFDITEFELVRVEDLAAYGTWPEPGQHAGGMSLALVSLPPHLPVPGRQPDRVDLHDRKVRTRNG